MSRPKTSTFVRMQRSSWIRLMLLVGSTGALAQSGSSPLARVVRPALTDAPLSGVLAALSRQSGVPFSYSSTRIGGLRRCRVRPGPPQPLGTVLHELAGQFRLSYGLLGGQLVLWPDSEPAPPGIAELNGLGQPIHRLPGPGQPAAPPVPAIPLAGTVRAAEGDVGYPGRSGSRVGSSAATKKIGAPGPISGPADHRAKAATQNEISPPVASRAGGLAGNRAAGRPAAVGLAATPTTRRSGGKAGGKMPGKAGGWLSAAAYLPLRSASSPEPVAAPAAADVPLVQPRAVALAGSSGAARELPALLPAGSVPAPALRPQLVVRRRVGQVSFLPPLSTNGMANARTVNDYSLNVLAGYAAGVSRLELGGLLNVVRDSVNGLQAAGLLNVTGTDARGVQLAGLANVNGGGVRGVQGAGLVNIARDDARGLQIAGLVNVTGGAARARYRPDQPTRLRRWLGLPRLLATAPLSQLPTAPSRSQRGALVQAAALANLTGTDVRGLQTAAVLNLAHRVAGVQLGLVNVARHVHGAQFGLINIADSVDGVSLGLITIVRHGYLRGEVWASEALPLNAVLKLGVRRYYTLLGAAAEPFGSRVQWASGFGIGTAGRPHGRFTFSLDIMQWSLAGTSDDINAESIDSRLLTQLRPAVAWQIERQGHLQLVVAPTLNLAIAWSIDRQPQWDFGANQLLLINTAGDQSRTRLWPGLQIGLRF